MNATNIISLLAFNANLQLAHWQADTLTSAHETLGKLYLELGELTDSLAEVYFAKSGNTNFEPAEINLVPNATHADLIATGLKIVGEIESSLVEADTDLANIAADIRIAINRAKYLLKA